MGRIFLGPWKFVLGMGILSQWVSKDNPSLFLRILIIAPCQVANGDDFGMSPILYTK